MYVGSPGRFVNQRESQISRSGPSSDSTASSTAGRVASSYAQGRNACVSAK